MPFDVEVVVRATGVVVQETLYHDGPRPEDWTEQDVRAVLAGMLLAIDRAANGGMPAATSVSLRGLSWIVMPFESGASIAIEIPLGSVVGGPFAIAEPALTGLVERAIAADARP